MKIGVVTFPGSCDDRDARARLARVLGLADRPRRSALDELDQDATGTVGADGAGIVPNLQVAGVLNRGVGVANSARAWARSPARRIRAISPGRTASAL